MEYVPQKRLMKDRDVFSFGFETILRQIVFCLIYTVNLGVKVDCLYKGLHPYSNCHEKRQFDVCGWVGFIL